MLEENIPLPTGEYTMQLEVSKQFPDRIKKLRKELGWSQRQIAKKVGADVQRISKYERGIIKPTADMIVKLALAFGVSLDSLMLNTPKQEPVIDHSTIKNRALLSALKQLESLPEIEQDALLMVIDAFIKKQALRILNKTDLTS